MGDEEAEFDLKDWARFLRCPSAELVKPGREMVFESSEMTSPLKKKCDMHMLVCNDVLVLSALKKKSTFSRKKPDLTWIEIKDLILRVDPESHEITLKPAGNGPPFPLFAEKEEVFNTVIDALKKVGAKVTLSMKSALKKREPSNREVESKTTSIDSVSSIGSTSSKSPLSSPSEEYTSMDGVKIAAVFRRMMMWADPNGDESSLSATSAPSDQGNQIKCIKVFQEILDTERTYVEDIRRLSSEYIAPLREASTKENGEKLISTEDLNLIFNNVGNILEVNAELLNSLQTGVLQISRNGEIPTLCEVAGVFAKEFVRVMPFFKMYWVYCHQYNAALDRVTSLRESNKELANFLQKREARKKNAQSSLQSLLIKPVQRICKYPLLFRELLNYMNKIAETRPDDSDFKHHVAELSRAEAEVQGIANMVNNRVSEAENQDQVMKVYLELGGENGCHGLVAPSRRFVKMQDVLMREAPFSENKRVRYRLYLFNDLIIFARIQNGTLGKVGTLGRNTSAFSGMIGSLNFKTGKSNLKVSHKFELDQCRDVKPLNYIDEDGKHAFELRRVCRVERTVKNGSLTGSTSTTPGSLPTKTTTQIQRFEVWGDNKESTEKLMESIQSALETLEENNGTRETAIPAKGKARAWASRARPRGWRGSYDGSSMSRDQSKNFGSLRRGALDSGKSEISTVQGSTRSIAESEAGENDTGSDAHAKEDTAASVPPTHVRDQSSDIQKQSLDDLKSRYAKAPLEQPDPKEGGTLKIDVDFPPGPLGIALENSKHPKGVLVACVAALSVAERSGIALGDRIVAVGSKSVPEDATWDQIVDIIKSLPRPLKLSFERTAETMAAGMKKNKSGKRNRKSNEASATPEEETATDRDSSTGTGVTGGRRQWAAKLEKRKAAMGTARLLSLKELEASYVASESAVSQKENEDVSKAFEALQKMAESQKSEDGKKALMKTAKVLEEIYNTEKSYVCDLRKIIGDYMLPLRQSRNSSTGQILETEDEQAIFLNVEGILKINSELLKNLQTGIAQAVAGDVNIDAFVSLYAHEIQEILPFLKIYSTYCHRYSTALAKLVSCRSSNKKLDEVLKQRESRPENQHSSLESLLIKPVQRICKYPLLMASLKEAVQKIPSALVNKEARTNLDKATVLVEGIAAQVNQKVNEAENIDRVLRIYERLGGEAGCPQPLVEPHRRFVSSDEVHILKAPFHEGKNQAVTLLLFNDLLLFAEARRRNSDMIDVSLKLLERIDLRKCDVKPHPSADGKAFQITQVTRNVTKHTNNGSTSSKVSTCVEKFRVTSKSKDESERLIKAISKEIDTLIELDTAASSSSSSTSGSLHHRNGSRQRTWNKRNGTAGKMSLEDVENRYNHQTGSQKNTSPSTVAS